VLLAQKDLSFLGKMYSFLYNYVLITTEFILKLFFD